MTNEKHDATEYPTAENFRFQFPEPHWCEIEEGRGYPSALRKVMLQDVEAFDLQMQGFYKANCTNIYDFVKSAFTLYRHLDAYLRAFICAADDGDKVLGTVIEELQKVDEDKDAHRQLVDFDGSPIHMDDDDDDDDDGPLSGLGMALAAIFGDN